jgi:uncharacterized protein (DUF2147 family)
MPDIDISRRSALGLTMIALAFLAVPTSLAQMTGEDAIIGLWEADDGSVKLDMYKEGTEFRARLLYGNQIMEADNTTFRLDTKNPDPALRSRSLEKIVFIQRLHWDNGEWSGGSLYDGSSGSTYRCRAEIKDGKMLLRGYLGISILGQTRAFHRITG